MLVFPGIWGDWDPQMHLCPANEDVTGFITEIHSCELREKDDTAMNVIRLKCRSGQWLSSFESQWWSGEVTAV